MTKKKCSLINKKTSKKPKSALLYELVKKSLDGDADATEKLEQVINQDPSKQVLVKRIIADCEDPEN